MCGAGVSRIAVLVLESMDQSKEKKVNDNPWQRGY
jgi:hypothetical protein